jgi:hypothetical protein
VGRWILCATPNKLQSLGLSMRLQSYLGQMQHVELIILQSQALPGHKQAQQKQMQRVTMGADVLALASAIA